MEVVVIDWLADCENCNIETEITVKTDGNSNYLYDGEIAKCSECGLEGTIHCDDGIAFVVWDKRKNNL